MHMWIIHDLDQVAHWRGRKSKLFAKFEKLTTRNGARPRLDKIVGAFDIFNSDLVGGESFIGSESVEFYT